MLANESAVPVEDRRRRDKERDQRSRGTRCENNAIRARSDQVSLGCLDLAPEDRELVTQDHDLHVFRNGLHPVDADQLERATRQTVEERQGHGPSSWLGRLWQVKPGREYLHPSPEDVDYVALERYALFMIELQSHVVHILGVTDHPTGFFVTQVARNLAGDSPSTLGRSGS